MAAAASSPISVALADNNPLMLSALSDLFERDSRFTLVATLSSAEAFLEMMGRMPTQIGVVDWALPTLGGERLLESLRGRANAPRILVHGPEGDMDLVRRAMAAGAAGFCARSNLPQQLIDVAYAVAQGQMVFPFIDVRALNHDPTTALTTRERALLSAVGTHIVALHKPPPQLLAVLMQVLCIGVMRHQSTADFRSLGLHEVSRACRVDGDGRNSSVSSVDEKVPNMVALSMRYMLKRDVDSAITLAYVACVLCSSSTAPEHDATADAAGISRLPFADVDFNGNRFSDDFLAVRASIGARQFLTLSRSWGFRESGHGAVAPLSSFCSKIRSVRCAAWLVEMTRPTPPARKIACTASRTLSGVLFLSCTSMPSPGQILTFEPATPSTARLVSRYT